MYRGRVLVIAGSDSGGGAGIQADIKAITVNGGYAATAITALTAQNTQGVFGVINTPPEFVKKQIELVLSDIGADVIKTGMLSNKGIIEAVAASLNEYKDIPLVVDPVMVATSGDSLLNNDSVNALKSLLIARAYLATPNIPEAEILSGVSIESKEDMIKAAKVIMSIGAKNVLLKGGHGKGEVISDLLLTKNEECWFENPYINSKNTHGTGCTLASSISCHLAKGNDLQDAVGRAIDYVRKAIECSDGFGALKHNWSCDEDLKS